MYKKFSPEEMKARGYVVIVRTFMNIINDVPESKAEKETADFMKNHPIEVMLIMVILSLIEKRLFKDCPEEE